MKKALAFVSLLSLGSIASVAMATTSSSIQVQGFWRLGESDPGAVAGSAGGANTADDSGHTYTLGKAGGGSPTYSANVAPKNSTIAVNFDGASQYNRAAIDTGTDNWGMEVWAYPTNISGGKVVFYNGDTSSAGYGIYQADDQWLVFYGGVSFYAVSGAPRVTLNQWTHLALVRDSGITTLYVNGQAFPVLGAEAPHPVSGNIHIGGVSIGNALFIGVLDEARLFTITSPFNPNDLLYNQAASSPAQIPTLSEYGMLVLASLLLGTWYWSSKRKQQLGNT